MKPEIGQIVHILPIGLAAQNGKKKELLPATVSKIGRKYFYVEGDNLEFSRGLRFHIDTWNQGLDKTYNNLNYKLYADPQDWYDEQEYACVHNWIKNQFEYGRLNVVHNVSLETLKAVKALLEGEKPS